MNRALSLHSQKIGLLLPLSRWPLPVRTAVKEQIEALARSLGWDPEKSLVWLDTDGNRDRLEFQLAQMVFVHHASVLIGGLTSQEAPHLATWAEHLRIPTIVVNRRFDYPESRYVFTLGPDPREQADHLARYMLGRGLRNIAVLMPQNSRDGQFIQFFQREAQQLRLTLSGPHLYNPADYNTIDQMLRDLLRIDDPARGPERLELLTRMKAYAAEQGVPFLQEQVVLPPIIEVDAILIADHFKNVRHLTKALAFYGVRRLPLFGLPKWRARELLDPPDELLQGSVFIDYLGSYEKLPYGIKPTVLHSEFLLAGADPGQIDLMLVLSHAYYAAQQTLRGPSVARHAMIQRLATAKPIEHPFFASPRMFSEAQTSYWPRFLFTVQERNFQLLQIGNTPPISVQTQARP